MFAIRDKVLIDNKPGVVTELENIEEVVAVKKELSPEQLAERNAKAISNRQLSNRLRRLADNRGLKLRKQPLSNIDQTWAIVLSTVFDNTKPNGKMEPFLR